MSTSSVGSSSAAVMNMLANHADEDVVRSVSLMKKQMQAEKDMINKLLPLPAGGLDIQT